MLSHTHSTRRLPRGCPLTRLISVTRTLADQHHDGTRDDELDAASPRTNMSTMWTHTLEVCRRIITLLLTHEVVEWAPQQTVPDHRIDIREPGMTSDGWPADMSVEPDLV